MIEQFRSRSAGAAGLTSPKASSSRDGGWPSITDLRLSPHVWVAGQKVPRNIIVLIESACFGQTDRLPGVALRQCLNSITGTKPAIERNPHNEA
ncbi:hypothetical protein [Mesorhizobium sp. M0213]|uniref:hypothetical protein n=1 Tax=Mesorhizobium sp. M0213 TaxID=2956917 RepID=UPI0033367F85